MSRSTTATRPDRRAVVLTVLVAILGSATASAQSAKPDLPDPALCALVVEDMGDVGLRISDAQVVAEAAVMGFKKRLGNDAVQYEGVYKNAAEMKRRLGPGAENALQDAQLAYYEACLKAAPHRVKVTFGKKASKHFVSATCRKGGAVLDEVKVEAATFQAAREAFEAKMPTFCPAAAPTAATTTTTTTQTASPTTSNAGGAQGTPAWQRKKTPTAGWQPPPVRE